MKADRSQLRELIDSQTNFPTNFIYKIIGKSSPAFTGGCDKLEKKFIHLKKVSTRESAKGAHLSFTFELMANSTDEIMEVYDFLDEIPDVVYIL